VAWLIGTDVSTAPPLAPVRRRLVRALQKSPAPAADVSLLFISRAKSRKLNAAFRGKDASANVLSFPLVDVPKGEHALGDIFIAAPIIRTGFSGEMRDEDIAVSLAIHGLLHLLGFDHRNGKDARAMDALHDRLYTP
jgi:probable rRNA maturation factor